MKLVAVIAAALATLLLSACGGSAEARPGNPAAVIPADAIAYLELNLGQLEAPPAALGALPGYRPLLAGLDRRFAAITGEPGPLDRGGAAHSSGYAAIALIPTGGTQAQLMIVVTARNQAAARRFLRRSAAPAARLLGPYLVIGDPSAVGSAARVSAGDAPSLARSSPYLKANAGSPSDPLLRAYVPAVGVATVLAGRSGMLGELGELLHEPGLSGAATTLSAGASSIDVWVRTLGASAAAAPGAAPPLGAVPDDVDFVIGVRDLRAAAPLLLAAVVRLGFKPNLEGALLRRIGKALAPQRAALDQVLAMFGDGAVAAITDSGGLLVVGRVAQAGPARVALAEIEGPLSELFPGTPIVSTRTLDGVTVSTLQVGPTQTLAFAVFDHLVAATTSPATLTAMIERRAPLLGSAAWVSAFNGTGSGAGPILFGNLSRLLTLAVQTGALQGPNFLGPLTPDLARIRLLGFRSGLGPNTTAELHLIIP
jgi:hypothetical protein